MAGHARLELVVGGVPPSASVINKVDEKGSLGAASGVTC